MAKTGNSPFYFQKKFEKVKIYTTVFKKTNRVAFVRRCATTTLPALIGKPE